MMEYYALTIAIICLLTVGPALAIGIITVNELHKKVTRLDTCLAETNSALHALQKRTPGDEKLADLERKVAALQLKNRQ
jgi:hypothetical protein